MIGSLIVKQINMQKQKKGEVKIFGIWTGNHEAHNRNVNHVKLRLHLIFNCCFAID